MPGTKMSLAQVMALTLWIVLIIYCLSIATGWAYKKWPNALTAAMYRVLTLQ